MQYVEVRSSDLRFMVQDVAVAAVTYVYYEEEPGRRSAAKLLSKDETQYYGVYLDDAKEGAHHAENPWETDIWYRCSYSGDILWNFDQPSFRRCSLVRSSKP